MGKEIYVQVYNNCGFVSFIHETNVGTFSAFIQVIESGICVTNHRNISSQSNQFE